jgi:ankyrin repeat protein
MQQLQTELLQLLLLGKENQKAIIRRLDQLIIDFGMTKIKSWRNFSNKKKNTLLHELVEMELIDVVRHFLTKYKFNVTIKRGLDGITPFQLAYQNQSMEMCHLLKKFGGDQMPTEDDDASSMEADKEKKMNIVWLDLEMTSLDDPQILECAVIITDKDLNELERCKSSFKLYCPTLIYI